MERIFWNKEALDAFCKAVSSFGASIEESTRCMNVLAKQTPPPAILSPKQYGKSLLNTKSK